jgi:hypothetical protein
MPRLLEQTRPVALGLGATGVWLLVVALVPPVPANAALALLLLASAMVVAAGRLRTRRDVVSALTAGVVTAAGTVTAVVVLMPRVPDRWVPPVVTVALTPADNLAQSRIETVDPYVLIGFLGVVMLACVATLTLRVPLSRLRATLRQAQAGPS